jgi:hypothetical protein
LLEELKTLDLELLNADDAEKSKREDEDNEYY